MEMQSVEKGKYALVKVCERCSETGSGRAGVIDRMSFLRGTFGVDPKPDGNTRRLAKRRKLIHL